eukprot:gnl/Spiro4/23664_TR11703_c0_g1_i1.p1 gnl/Spiro4/23664_TR11703_c0_g1~~gnl/Spiro4/23664_TR11703_c0_g1_i1.p1  ORF type:complete len:616 (-),score=90.38 gnl/Spiro4/23664_TR11703_c0_g1_i1:93-1940(-)
MTLRSLVVCLFFVGGPVLSFANDLSLTNDVNLLQLDSTFIQHFQSNPAFPDLYSPRLTAYQQFFANSVAPPVRGNCDCRQCRALIVPEFSLDNCKLVYDTFARTNDPTVDEDKRATVTPDQADLFCRNLELQWSLNRPQIQHTVSWYVCSCIGCCPGDCFYRPAPELANAVIQTTRAQPIVPVASCVLDPSGAANILQNDRWLNWLKCSGFIKPRIGWKRVVSFSVKPEICTQDTLTLDEAYSCQWLQTVLENQLEGVLDTPNVVRTNNNGINDYAAHYTCACLGCGVGDVKCEWHGPVFEPFRNLYTSPPPLGIPYQAAYATGTAPPGLLPLRPVTDVVMDMRSTVGVRPSPPAPKVKEEPADVRSFREKFSISAPAKFQMYFDPNNPPPPPSKLADLDDETCATAVKDMLHKAASVVSTQLSTPGGFLQSPDVFIPYPTETPFSAIKTVLGGIPEYSKQIEQLTTSMNDVAESTCKSLSEALFGAIDGLNLQESKDLLSRKYAGTDHDCTRYLEDKTREALTTVLTQILATVLNSKSPNFVDAFEALKEAYLKTPLHVEVTADRKWLINYVVTNALKGVFLRLSTFEKEARGAPDTLPTDAAKKVFSAQGLNE